MVVRTHHWEPYIITIKTMNCPNCKEENISVTEWMWAYDWWMELTCKVCDKDFHRTNNEEIEEFKQPEKYGAVYYKTPSAFFRNLTEITKEQYESAK